MIPFKTFEPILKKSVFWLVLVVSLVQLVVCRGLYADGANFLFNVLDQQGFVLPDKHRYFNHILTQFPLVLALKFGLSNLFLLRFIYSSWILFLPLFFWLLALHQLRRSYLFWPFVALFSFVYYNTAFFAVGEYNLCFALFACCLAGLLREDKTDTSDRILLFSCAFLLPLNYAASIFLGALLSVIALARLKHERHVARRWQWITLAALFVLTSASGVWEVLTPRDPGNFANAQSPQILFVDWPFWVTTLSTGLVVGGLFEISRRSRALMAYVCFGLAAALVLVADTWEPFDSYAVRMYVSFALMALSCALFCHRFDVRRLVFRSVPRKDVIEPFVLPIFVLLLILSLLDIGYSFGYGRFVGRYTKIVDAHHGLVPYDTSGLEFDRDDYLYNRMWTNPVMSMVLRRDASRGIILNPKWYSGYEPFDPVNHIPDFNRYYPPLSTAKSK